MFNYIMYDILDEVDKDNSISKQMNNKLVF